VGGSYDLAVDAGEGLTTEQLRRQVAAALQGALEAERHSRALKAWVLGRIRCEECGSAWRDRRERWRAYTVDDVVLLYCSDCAEREFGA
jgi:hypothetical protein